VSILIVYGSLYPWTFEARQFPANPLYILLHSWDANSLSRRLLLDVVLNIAVYIPLGGSAYLAMRGSKFQTWAALAAVAIGTLLSASVEMAQLFTPNRVCSAVDLVSNSLGSALGVLAGFVLKRISGTRGELLGFHFRDRSALALLLCWVSFLLFPLYPDLWLAALRAKFSAVIDPSGASFVLILLNAAEWFVAGRLLLASGARSPLRWLLVLILLVPVQFAIVNHSPKAADFFGAALAAVAFRYLGTRPGADGWAATALLIALTLRGLAPFHFEGPPQAFSWVPFGGFLGSEWQNTISILLGKLFQYGGSIWLLNRAGLGASLATAIVIAILSGIEILQTWTPEHVAEITDPLLALLLCLGFHALGRR